MIKEKALIIAEAGVNHDGNIEKAKELVRAAAYAGADIVKFQTFSAKKLVTPEAIKAKYQINQTGLDETQYEMLKKLELSDDDHKVIKAFSENLNIEFLSSAFDEGGLKFLAELGVKRIKIPSGEITNKPYLQQAGDIGHPIILSTGMSTLADIEGAISVLLESGVRREMITLLHCNSQYPTQPQDVNLSAMNTIGAAFNTKYGYSDHTEGIEIPIAAVAMGACVIEKHFTLDSSAAGPDHSSSIEPETFKKMVAAIRNVERALGTSIKEPSASEFENLGVVRKSLVASRDITKGERFASHDLSAKRPGGGISPMRIDDVIGRQAVRDFKENEQIEI